jgi:hypothetical protein
MKYLLLVLLLVSASAFAGLCGRAPSAPFGTYYICVCDKDGLNCNWVLVSKK